MKISFNEIGSGNPVVLLHAFPLSGDMWKSQAEALAKNGFRVILPDVPGFGTNDQTGFHLTIEETAIEVAQLFETLKIEKAIVGGLSMGGYILFNLLRYAAERISALIFCDTTFSSDTTEKVKSRFKLISKIKRQGSMALVESMLPNLISDFTKQNNPILIENLKEKFLRVSPDAAINALKSMAERNDNSEIVAQISVPTLILFGEFDQVTNLENAEILSKLIPDSKLVVIKNAGHYSNLEQPEQFNKTLVPFCRQIKF